MWRLANRAEYLWFSSSLRPRSEAPPLSHSTPLALREVSEAVIWLAFFVLLIGLLARWMVTDPLRARHEPILQGCLRRIVMFQMHQSSNQPFGLPRIHRGPLPSEEGRARVEKPTDRDPWVCGAFHHQRATG